MHPFSKMLFRWITTSLVSIPLLLGCHFLEGADPPSTPIPATLPDASLFISPECEIGCWRNLKPGVSNKADVYALFQSLGFSQITEGGANGYTWIESSSTIPYRYGVTAYIYDDRLTKLLLKGPFNLTLHDLELKFGGPKLYYVQIDSFGPTSVLEIRVMSYYPEHGLVVGTLYYDDNANSVAEFCIRETDVVDRVFIVSPTNDIRETIRQYYADPFGGGLSPNQITDLVRESTAWTGFGCTSTTDKFR